MGLGILEQNFSLAALAVTNHAEFHDMWWGAWRQLGQFYSEPWSQGQANKKYEIDRSNKDEDDYGKTEVRQ